MPDRLELGRMLIFYIRTFGHQNKRMFKCLLRGRFPIHVSYLFILSSRNLHNKALAKSEYEVKSLFCKDKLRNSTSVKFFACSSSGTHPLIAGCGCGRTFKCNFMYSNAVANK